jgi:8-oxo-dGTP pyrophosphatase MutT (NUDIX family)
MVLKVGRCPSDDPDVVARPQVRDSAFAVIVREEYVLLVRARKRKKWQLPGGGLKRRETPLEALRREVDEETGLRARVHVLSGAYLREDGSVAHVYLASVAADAEPAGPRNEIRHQRWVRRRKALRLLPRRVRARLQDALQRYG